MTSIESVFRNFQGEWRLMRQAVSMRTRQLVGEASGTVVFTALSETEYEYKEQGTAIYPPLNEEQHYSRQYRYVLNNQHIDLYHLGDQKDGEFYQSYALNDSGDELSFVEPDLCSADRYEGMYKLIDDNHFMLTTQQFGPKKDNIITTNFYRITP